MEYRGVPALEMRGITKRFGDVVANHNVNLQVYPGEVLAVLGENGCGKTTLMNMASGIYFPDEGHIYVNGEEAVIRSPKDAFDHKIGMVHQHFKLVDIFTAAENIVLGMKRKDGGSLKTANKTVSEIAGKYGFTIDPKKKIYDMSVSEKQTVEIIKVLYRGADILILDEPTAVLTLQEIRKLFSIMRNMVKDGKSIIIITHKLNEVMEVSDRVAIMRKGEHVATVNTSETNEAELTEMMVGKKITLNIDRSMPVSPAPRLKLKGLNATNRDGLPVLKDVSFEANSGEILGIAGIAGSGQKELLEAVAGLQPLDSGEIIFCGDSGSIDLQGKTPLEIHNLGVSLSFVPEDRLGMGLVGSMGIADNMMLRSYRKGVTPFLEYAQPQELADRIVRELEVVTPSISTPVRQLSGGNVQKVLVGREISSNPKVLMTAYPVRGLDINSSYTIYNLLNRQKESGAAVIYVGEDLDVLMELCDRILVMNSGAVVDVVDARSVTKEELGYMMTKTHGTESGFAEEGRNEENEKN